MGFTCENCKTEITNPKLDKITYHSHELCEYCFEKVKGQAPQTGLSVEPLTLITAHHTRIIQLCDKMKKLLKKYGYYYKCFNCYFVSVDLNPLCSKCQTPKKLDEKSLSKSMPLGWS